MDDRVIDNAIAKRAAQEAAQPIAKRINTATGKVPVFLLHEEEMREVFAVDAREMLAMGVATLDPPAPEPAPRTDGNGEGGADLLDGMTILELKAYAANAEPPIDVSACTKRAEYIATICDAQKADVS